MTELEMELARTKRELAEVKMERKDCNTSWPIMVLWLAFAASSASRKSWGYAAGRRGKLGLPPIPTIDCRWWVICLAAIQGV